MINALQGLPPDAPEGGVGAQIRALHEQSWYMCRTAAGESIERMPDDPARPLDPNDRQCMRDALQALLGEGMSMEGRELDTHEDGHCGL